jgi:hypothetical protein
MLCPETLGLSLPRTVGITDHTNSTTNEELWPKNLWIEEVSRGLRAQDHPQRCTKRPPMFPPKNSEGKPSQIRGINQRTKASKVALKRPTEITMSNLLYNQERFVQGLACLLNIHSSLKISPWSSQTSHMENIGKIGRENSKSKWARVSRDGSHPLSSKYLWRLPKDETTTIT